MDLSALNVRPPRRLLFLRSVLSCGESVITLSFPCLSMAQNEAGVSTGQHRVGNPKVWHCLEKTLPKLTHLLLALLTFLSVILHRTVGFPLSLVFAVPTDVWYFVSKSLSSREKNYNVGESHQVPG